MFLNNRRNVNHRSIGNKDENERPMRIISFPKQHLPDHVDLRRWMTPVEYQQDMHTCCANAFAGICEYFIKRRSGHHIDVSRLFIYYNAQIISQRTRRVADDGVYQRDTALALRKYGICDEKIWPYKKVNLSREPSVKSYDQASQFTVLPLRISCDIQSIETCLANQIPVLIDIVLVDLTGRQIKENGGILPIPKLSDQIIEATGLHTVVLVGYDRRNESFIARNSWGADWGSQGYFRLPYQFLSHHRLINSQDGLWTIMEIIPRTDKLPTVRQLALPTQDHRHQHHRHHHHHH